MSFKFTLFMAVLLVHRTPIFQFTWAPNGKQFYSISLASIALSRALPKIVLMSSRQVVPCRIFCYSILYFVSVFNYFLKSNQDAAYDLESGIDTNASTCYGIERGLIT